MRKQETAWTNCRNILCIRPDNMGDVLMSSPAIRALKETFGASITLLTSSAAASIVPHLSCIDDLIVYNLPWIKAGSYINNDDFFPIINEISKRQFDAAVIFTVFSQNPLPSAMIAYLAGIPRRLGYCRENPYELLTDWIPDKEPYSMIRHQVQRDLDLVAHAGAYPSDIHMRLNVSEAAWQQVIQKLLVLNVDLANPWMIVHPGVSEKKREYPAQGWVKVCQRLQNELGVTVLLTGNHVEQKLTDYISEETLGKAVSVAGLFSIEEFIALVAHAPVVLSVNTGTVHIAAAVNTPVAVLYALTNPQHTPWQVPHAVIPFDVPQSLRSKNEVLRYVYNELMEKPGHLPTPDEIILEVKKLLAGTMNQVESSSVA
jgi:lipopolysaccharide heptosyltransferase II